MFGTNPGIIPPKLRDHDSIKCEQHHTAMNEGCNAQATYARWMPVSKHADFTCGTSAIKILVLKCLKQSGGLENQAEVFTSIDWNTAPTDSSEVTLCRLWLG